MDADELIRRYEAGERDFQDAELEGANLRGALTSLRQQTGDYLILTRDTVAIKPEADIRRRCSSKRWILRRARA